jgi:hypothetical protein
MTDTMPLGDITIQPPTMWQTMHTAACMVGGLLPCFFKEEHTDEEKMAISYTAIALFLYQFCGGARHKDKMLGVLRAVVAQLEEELVEAAPKEG